MHGVVFAHYEVGERAAEAYALITLYESGYARQVQLARSFGYLARSLRRYQARFEAGGMGALARDAGRQVGARVSASAKRGDTEVRGQDCTVQAASCSFGCSPARAAKRTSRSRLN